MESIFQFWNRAFPNLTWSRDCEVRRDSSTAIWRPATLTFASGIRNPLDLLPPSAIVLVEKVSGKPVDGAPLADLTFDDFARRTVPAITRTGDKVVFHFDPEKSINAMLREWSCPPPRPLASWAPFHYHAVPGAIRRIIGRVTTMLGPKLGEGYPPWPVADGVEVLRRCVLLLLAEKMPDLNKATFWPNGKKWAVALSHDVDTEHGAARLPEFLHIEKRHGLRSTWFFPARHYPIDKALLQGLIGAGHEVACHGYNHDCKLPYLKAKWIGDRLGKCARILSPFGVKGFRSPALARSPEVFAELPRHFAYDSSVPDTEAGSGCCTVFPFFMDDLLELPITVPMDATLMLHGYRPNQIRDVWLRKLEWIKGAHGLATIVTHPEPHFSGNAAMLGVYAELLAHLAKDGNCWIAPMAEIAEWWRGAAPERR